MAKTKVFVSHPFADNPVLNRKKVDKICKDLVKQGFIPISPLHLFSFYEDDSDREEILQFCYKLIDNCDIVHIYGDSEGCRKEHGYAVLTGKPVEVKV
jgi:nucleoside 2-deoxyribosyltransferase